MILSSSRAILLAAMLAIAGGRQASCAQPELRIADEGMAREWCDNAPLHRIEGIWEFPEDKTRVLIRRSDPQGRSYDLVAVSTPDCRIRPGDAIGHISQIDGQSGYKLELLQGGNVSSLTGRLKCKATLSSDEAHISVEAPRIKISLRNVSFLPKFMRMLRLSLDDPASSSKFGLVRIYPRQLYISEPLYY